MGAPQVRPVGDDMGVPGDCLAWQPHLAQNLVNDIPRRGSSQVVIKGEVRDRGRARRGQARSVLAFLLELPPQTQEGL